MSLVRPSLLWLLPRQLTASLCVTLQQAKHSLDKLFEGLLVDVLREKPADPLQFIIDSLSLGPEHAAQASHQPCVCALCGSSCDDSTMSSDLIIMM